MALVVCRARGVPGFDIYDISLLYNNIQSCLARVALALSHPALPISA